MNAMPTALAALMLSTILIPPPVSADDARILVVEGDFAGGVGSAGATLAVEKVPKGGGAVVLLTLRDADGREVLGFDLGDAAAPRVVYLWADLEAWAAGEAGVFGWRREPDGLFRAIEFTDAEGKLIRPLPEPFFERLTAASREVWGEQQRALVKSAPAGWPEPVPVEPFRIRPTRPIAEIRAEALKATPPREAGEFLKPDLVDLATLGPRIRLEVRYATADNFLGTPVYTSARAFLQRPAAEALARAQAKLGGKGLGLLIHDGYRPWHVTKVFRLATPERYHDFVADPDKGSRHNRGCAVDLTLYDLKTGRAVDMPTGYDDFSRCAFSDFPGVTRAQEANRAALRDALEAEGFLHLPEEWWHFDYKDWKRYPIQDLAFEDQPGR